MFFVNNVKFSRSPALKNICGWLLLLDVIWHNQSKEVWLLHNQPFQNKNIKIISKIMNLKKMQCFATKACGFNIIFISEDLFFKSVLSSHNKNTGLATTDSVKSSQMSNETPLQPYRLFFHVGTGIIFLLFRSQTQCF